MELALWHLYRLRSGKETYLVIIIIQTALISMLAVWIYYGFRMAVAWPHQTKHEKYSLNITKW